MKLGRRPLWASPYRVNCETTSTAPPTSSRARFILSSASQNRRRLKIFSAIQVSVSSVSPGDAHLDGGEDLRSEEHTSELQSQFHLVCRLLLEKKKEKSLHRLHY